MEGEPVAADLSAARIPMDDSLANDARAEAMARKYVWWQPPELTLADRRLLLAQMMTLGTLDDVRWLVERVSEDSLRAVLRDPPVGVFNGRSWNFWHLRLGCHPVPALPARPMRSDLLAPPPCWPAPYGWGRSFRRPSPGARR